MALENTILALDVLVVCAAIAMAIQAWKAHKSFKTGSSLAFLWCFSLIALGIIFSTLTDVLVRLASTIPYIAAYSGTQLLATILPLAGVLGVLSGYTILLLVVERIMNKSMWVLVLTLIILTIVIGADLFLVTHLVAIVLLALLVHNFWKNYQRKPRSNALLVYFAFLSLVIAHVASLFISFGPQAHVVFLALRLVGYFLLFAVTWRVTH